MKCRSCGRAIKPNEEVFVADSDVCCSKECCSKFDAGRKQKRLFTSWEKRRYVVRQVDIQGSVIAKVAVPMKDSHPTIQVTVNVPGGVSVDQLVGFAGESISTRFIKGELKKLEGDKPAKGKAQADGKAPAKDETADNDSRRIKLSDLFGGEVLKALESRGLLYAEQVCEIGKQKLKKETGLKAKMLDEVYDRCWAAYEAKDEQKDEGGTVKVRVPRKRTAKSSVA